MNKIESFHVIPRAVSLYIRARPLHSEGVTTHALSKITSVEVWERWGVDKSNPRLVFELPKPLGKFVVTITTSSGSADYEMKSKEEALDLRAQIASKLP